MTNRHVVQEVVLSFGKHKGKPIKQVDDAYLRWMQAHHSSLRWRNLAFQVLEQRKKQQEAGNTMTEVCELLAELKVCSSTKNLEKGKQIHAEAMESGKESSIYVATALVNMYAKCGSMIDAHQVFDKMNRPNVVSWNALMVGYSQNGEAVSAWDLFGKMKSQGFAPTSITYVAVLKACTSLALKKDKSGRTECLERGKQIHSEIGCHLNIYVQNTLICMYTKCRSMADARRVFDGIEHPEVLTWNTLILGYAENGEGATALDLFARMKSQGFVPNSVTYVAALKGCIALKSGSLERVRQIHSEIGCHSNMFVQSTLIDMYAKCGSMSDARLVFDSIKHPDVVSWNVLMLGYSEKGEAITALDLFARMKIQNCTPDLMTFVAALKSCTSLALKLDRTGRAECLRRGKQIHLEIGYHSDIYVQNTLIDMYAKCGSIEDARLLFESIKHPDVISWNALMLGYTENGESATALELFAKMRSQGYAPSRISFMVALKACGLLGALECGRKVHAAMHTETAIDVTLVTCLVDFYAKCGSLLEAQKIFELYSRTRDLTTWNALLAGYSRVGATKVVFELFQGMQDAGCQPNGITFLCILTCCSHAGLIEKAKECFEAMTSTNYRITPTVEHYNCMVDMLGRSNKLDDAMTLLQSMPCKPNAVTWMTALSACRKWKNVEFGRLAFKSLVSLDDSNAAAYVLMARTWEYGSKR